MRQQQDLVQQQVAVECGDFILKTHLDLKCEFKVVFYFWKPFYSYYQYIKLIVIFLSPLNPKIKIWILICCPYSFPTSLQLSDKMGDSRKYPYHTTDGFKDFRRGGGIHDYGILKAWGGIYDLKSEGMGEFHRWDFWSRKCRVSSWKTLLLWTFVVRK